MGSQHIKEERELKAQEQREALAKNFTDAKKLIALRMGIPSEYSGPTIDEEGYQLDTEGLPLPDGEPIGGETYEEEILRHERNVKIREKRMRLIEEREKAKKLKN